MRIIRGRFKKRRYDVPKKFPSRPTTDFAKEGLFNILENQLDLSGLKILDLCAGTGNISFEFLSREAGFVTSVDKNFHCIRHIRQMAEYFGCVEEIDIIQADIFKFLQVTAKKFDLIFADPPFDFKSYEELVDLIFERNLLNEDGILIVEHSKECNLENKTHFAFSRKFGHVHFSFFKNDVK